MTSDLLMLFFMFASPFLVGMLVVLWNRVCVDFGWRIPELARAKSFYAENITAEIRERRKVIKAQGGWRLAVMNLEFGGFPVDIFGIAGICVTMMFWAIYR